MLSRASPPAYTAVIHEAALRMQFGGRKTTRTQLQHILDMSEGQRKAGESRDFVQAIAQDL